MRKKQQGITLIGLMFIGAILACVILVGAQVLPTVIEYQAVHKAAKRAAEDGGDTVASIRAAFDRQANMDAIKSIAGRDLEITKGGDGTPIVSFEYDRELHLFGPAYLVMKYKGSTMDTRRARD